MKHTNPVPRSGSITLAVWVLFAACTAGCATSFDPGPVSDLRDMRQTSPPGPVHEPPDPITPPPEPLPVTSELVPTTVIPDGTPAPADLIEPTWRSMAAGSRVVPCSAQLTPGRSTDGKPTCDRWVIPTIDERRFGNDMPLRPPLRQLWFRHPRLVPLGDDAEFGLPDSEILAHRDRVTSHPFRNPYAGFRDQPLFHRDSSRAPVTDSRLPEIGPPPPKHTIKTQITLGGLSLVGAGVYAFAPSSFTGGKKEGQWEDAWGHFKEAWTKPPVFDKDPAIVNYLGHPYFGANFYLSQRNLGESPLYSFLVSVFSSTFFEYMLESWSEQPSINDLIVTPVVGSILGELVYQATQEMRKDGFTKAEKIILTIINPLYVLQNGYH